MSEHDSQALQQIWEEFGGERLLGMSLDELNTFLKNKFVAEKDAVLEPSKRLEGCMDEGVAGKSIGLGGPGIVLAYFAGKEKGKEGLAAVEAGMEDLIKILDGEIDTITSHAGCGACGIINNLLPEGEQCVATDDHGITFAKTMAEKLGAEYSHVDWNTMTRPKAGHTARIVFYNGGKHLSLDNVVPNALAFTVSRGILEKLDDPTFTNKIGKLLLETACKIALGDHGLGDLSTTTSPFVIIPIGGIYLPLEEVKKEAEKVAEQFAGKVTVLTGFTLV